MNNKHHNKIKISICPLWVTDLDYSVQVDLLKNVKYDVGLQLA